MEADCHVWEDFRKQFTPVSTENNVPTAPPLVFLIALFVAMGLFITFSKKGPEPAGGLGGTGAPPGGEERPLNRRKPSSLTSIKSGTSTGESASFSFQAHSEGREAV